MHKEMDRLTQAFPRGVTFCKFNCGNFEEFSTKQRIRSLPTFRCVLRTLQGGGSPMMGPVPLAGFDLLTPWPAHSRLPRTRRLFKGGRMIDQVTGAKPIELRQLLVHYVR